MKQELFFVCEADDSAAVALQQAYGKNSPPAILVKRALYDCTQEELDSLEQSYELKQVRTSGCGYSFGTAEEDAFDPDAQGEAVPMNMEKLVLDPQKGCIVGYCYGDQPEGAVFLPLEGGYRKVDYEYHYQVFPTDGTSSEYSCTTYAKLKKRH